MARTNEHVAEPMSVTACRRLLGGAGSSLSDTEVLRLRDQFYEIARCTVTAFKQSTHEETTAVESLPVSMREEVEERAAILEFDAQVPRPLAIRAAVAAHVPDAAKDE
jgi:hypothetical protein